MSIGSGSVARVRGLLSYQGIELWRHSVVVRWTLQIVSAVVVVVLVAWFFANIADAVQNREIPHGWGFLDRAYGTPVGQHFLPYESTDSFAYAFGVAAVNTAVVSVVGMLLATVLGLLLGLARLSGNWLVARLATVYVDIFRNVPLLVQLFFWFYVILSLPPVREGYVIGGMFINNGGLSLPFPNATGVGAALAWSLLGAGAVATGYAAFRLLGGWELRTGRPSYAVYVGIATAFADGAVAWFLVSLANGEPPFVMSFPEPEGRFGRLEGGFTAPGALVVLLAGPRPVHRSVYCRGRAVGHRVDPARTGGGVTGAGTESSGDGAVRHAAAAAARYLHAALGAVSEPDQEQQLGRGRRLC